MNIGQLIEGIDWWRFAIELAVIWLCVYIIFRFLQGTRGAGVIKGFAIVLVVVTVAVRLLAAASDTFSRLNFIYDRFIGLIAILLIVVFQPELRQAMGRLGQAMQFRKRRTDLGTVVHAVSEAAEFLSKNRFGAVIAIERRSLLGGIAESGVALDALVDARLLESIFWPNSPLHDLGVVIRGDRIVAASVQFPLVEEGALPMKYGSRHRAAVGLSLECDCVVVIVSEETGAISIAEHGRIDDDIDRDQLPVELALRLAAQPKLASETADDADAPDDAPKSEADAGAGPATDADTEADPEADPEEGAEWAVARTSGPT